MNALGLHAEVLAPGQARVWGTVRPEFLNSWGSAHGGFLYSVADAAFALASNSHGTLAVALAAHIEYVRASEVGATVEARAREGHLGRRRAREVHLGRRTAVYRVEVCSGAKLLALFTGTVYRKTGQPASLSAKVG